MPTLKDKSRIEKRKEFVKSYINENANKGMRVRFLAEQLADKLFISLRTIYNDLKS